jgi:hypothetical protein
MGNQQSGAGGGGGKDKVKSLLDSFIKRKIIRNTGILMNCRYQTIPTSPV